MQNSLSNKNPNWQIAGASSIGKSHLDSRLPNQDRFFTYQDSDICVAVVCDGAGSAKMSEEGAGYFAKAVGDFLVTNAQQFEINFPQNNALNAEIIQTAFATIRQNLAQQIPAEFSLKDYHSTVTAVLVLPALQKTLLLQIGDSPLLTSQFKVTNQSAKAGQQLDYFANLQVFGEDSTTEYVNETHFITQENWRDFLRIEWLDTQSVDCIALMSDGCGDLVLAGGTSPRQVYRPFFGNLVFNLLQTQDRTTADSLIKTTLDNPATYRLTGDDKTLIVLLKNQPNTYQNFEPLLENSESLSEGNLSNTAQSVWQTSVSNLSETNQENTAENPSVIDNAEKVENRLLPETALPEMALPETALPPTPLTSVENVINRHETTANAEALPQPVPADTPNATKKLALVGVGSLIAVGIATTAWLMRSEPPISNANSEPQPVPTTLADSSTNATSAPLSSTISTPSTISSPVATPISIPISPATAVAHVTTASSATASQR